MRVISFLLRKKRDRGYYRGNRASGEHGEDYGSWWWSNWKCRAPPQFAANYWDEVTRVPRPRCPTFNSPSSKNLPRQPQIARDERFILVTGSNKDVRSDDNASYHARTCVPQRVKHEYNSAPRSIQGLEVEKKPTFLSPSHSRPVPDHYAFIVFHCCMSLQFLKHLMRRLLIQSLL